MANAESDEDDKILGEFLNSTHGKDIQSNVNCQTSRDIDKKVTIEDIAGPSGAVSFTSAFAFLQKDAEAEYKACLPSGVSARTFALGSGNAIIVNPCQRGNPLLENIRNVPWQYADRDSGMVPDYIMSATSCCLFLSLRYHALKPNYIYDRIQTLRKTGQYSLRVLLGLVDVKEPAHAVKELAKAALVSEMTLLLAFSNEEAGTYLETFKAYRNKPADLIQTRVKKEFTARLAETLSSVKSINSTDAHTLLSTYKNLSNVAKASEHDLALLPGFGGLKAKRLHNLFRQPFLKEPKKE